MIKILCGSYNKKDYVLDAFNSILDQTFRDWQLVILENSTDGDTREVVKQWVKEQKDDRIKLKIRNYSPEYRKKFYIPAQFINEEYNKRDADYYFWISDDDIIDPETLERLYIELQEDRRFVSYAGVQCMLMVKLRGS
jgi:glycosyltransferase involved in cell wall biosynthesis